MKYLLFLVACLFMQATFAQLVINDPNAELRPVAPFHSIKVSGGVDLLLSKGDQQAVAVSDKYGDKTSSILADVKDGVLYISIDKSVTSVQRKKSFKAYVSYTRLDSIDASGATDVRFAESIQQERLSIEVSGASNLKANVNVLRLRVAISGASDVKLTGFAEELDVKASGASDFKGYGLTAKRCDANVSGASDAQITAEDLLIAHSSGASSLRYKGSPKKVEVNKSGASDVIRVN